MRRSRVMCAWRGLGGFCVEAGRVVWIVEGAEWA